MPDPLTERAGHRRGRLVQLWRKLWLIDSASRRVAYLGFHIYDVGFQSPNIEAAKPMVFTTTLLLIGIVILLNLTAIALRDRIRKKYKTGAF